MTETNAALDFDFLITLRDHHPSWRLLRSDHAPLIASFLHRVFIVPNVRVIAAADLAEALDDDLYALRSRLGNDAFPRAATDYLDDWAGTEKAWLRKFYVQGSDEPQFDLTPATEKAIAWLSALTERHFVGTESRLLTLFELLRQMSEGTETDPAKRVADLQKRRDELDEQISRIAQGDIPLLDETALKERFQQFMQVSRELLSDFREVEQNFRKLDRRVRERIALWEGAKGELLDEIMGEHDAIGDSDQGRSFRAFWDFLMSSQRQEELGSLLHQVLELPPVADMKPDVRTRRVHYDWLEAGEHTQRTVAQLSEQLRRFLDDKAWLENRRIMEILHGIEIKALALRESPPTDTPMEISAAGIETHLIMERPLYSPPVRSLINNAFLELGDSDMDASALYDQVVIDRGLITRHIHQSLQQRSQITLQELIRTQPLQHGLAELLVYLQLGADSFKTVIDEDSPEVISWDRPKADGSTSRKHAQLPRFIFVR